MNPAELCCRARDPMPYGKDNDRPDDRGNNPSPLVRAVPVYGPAKKGGDDAANDAQNGREDKSLGIIG